MRAASRLPARRFARWGLGLHASFGVGLRYTPAQGRLFATADMMLHKNLRYLPVNAFGLIMTPGANIGVGVLLGRRSPAPAAPAGS